MKTWYWNSDNFEGLKSVADRYADRPGFNDFVDYCRLKEKGLNKQATQSIRSFVSHLETLTLRQHRKVADELVSLAFSKSEVHQLLPYPLCKWIESVLETWIAENQNEVTPYRWLGFLRRESSYFKDALKIDPRDQISLTILAAACLSAVDFQTHHLFEETLIGTIEDAQASLREAEALINGIENEKRRSLLKHELETLTDLLNKWQEYNRIQPNESFVDWCKSQGKEFIFPSVVYYDD